MPNDIFDADIARTDDTDLAVDVLAELAGDGAVLEFPSRTGRIALPLAARGVHVHGIELSEAMVAQMTRKPGADQIPVEVGDRHRRTTSGSTSPTWSTSDRPLITNGPRWRRNVLLVGEPMGVSGRVRPHGAPHRHDPRTPLGRLASDAVHR